jgi:SAM-dependent methyltransferase
VGQLESWQSEYAVEWASDDVLAELLELPRRISIALVRDADVPVGQVIDLGSGHGPYLERFLDAFPDARGTWVDSSEEMHALAQQRLARFGDRVGYVLADVERLDDAPLEPASVIVTSRVLHHFSPESLQGLYRAVHGLLEPGGFFFNLDHVGAAGNWEQRFRRIRPQFIPERKRELKPHRHDYPLARAEEHADWLRAAGFEAPDSAWRTLYSVLLVAQKR